MTDCSKEFVLKGTWAYLLDKNVQLITTTPYHPQANSCVEQLNSVLLLALRKLSSEDPLSWPKHLPTALLMARSRINRDIHFSLFEMVYSYKPEIQELPNGLKLIEPEVVPQENKISPELLAIRSKASEQGLRRVCEQELKKYVKFQMNNKVWYLNPDKRKLASKLIGLYTVISVNKEPNTCLVQDKRGV